MSDSWNRVEQILRPRLAEAMDDPPRADAWLAALRDAGNPGLLLAISLAIDVLTGWIDAADLAALFRSVEPRPGERALDQIDTMSQPPPVHEVPPATAYEHGGYVRIVELRGFVEKYLRRPFDPENVQIVRHEFLNDPRANRLSEVQNAWSGRKGRVWVLPMKEFEEARRLHGASLAEFLNDALGLAYDAGSEFLVVFYPPDFEERFCRARKPTSFDATWQPASFYISYINDDGWGRTQSCSGRRCEHRERVHETIEALTDEFSLEWLGVAERMELNETNLTAAALRRLDEAEARARVP